MKISRWCILIIVLLFAACGDESCNQEEGLENIEIELDFEQLQDQLFTLTNPESVTYFLDQNPVIAEVFYQRSQYPHDSIVINTILNMVKNQALDTVRMEVDKVYGDMSDLKEEFTSAFKRIKLNYPEFEPPKIKTIVTGFTPGSDLYVSPDLIVIGIDWFLGDEAKYKPFDIPKYILDRMDKEHLVASCIMFMSDPYNETDLADETLLAEMLYYAKAYEFTKQMMPCTNDSIILGYSPSEMDGIDFNQERIWAHFVEASLLYEKNHFLKTKYINERPNIPEIGDACPGRIGRWLGWEILKAYKEQADVDFKTLMLDKDATKIFTQSKYRPRRR